LPSFFIDRPVFAWVIALVIMIAGALSLPGLPVAQFPRLAPPRVEINTVYPGATAETVDANVASIIEESLDGADGLLYYESGSDGLGDVSISATFEPGTNPDLAVVDVQNRLKQIEPRLPQQVIQQGISVSKSSGSFLMVVALSSTDGQRDSSELGNYMSRYVVREIKRVPGVASAQLWDSDRAMRIWLDPVKLREYGLSADEVMSAIGGQNIAVAAGTLGEAPFVAGQQLTANIVVKGQLTTPAEFGAIVIKALPNGAIVHLNEIATVEFGEDNYTFYSRLNGKAAATMGVQLAPDGNALATSKAIRDRLADLSKSLPPGVAVHVPYDASTYVHVAIREVAITLAEAILLVFVVMRLFLRDWRYTLIPTVVIPVTLMGSCAVLAALGYSVNTFTMFGMVLSIGILVDDAIVVVENVERIMREQALPPREATRQAMKQIVGALIGVTVVLTAVFVPLACMRGGVGGVYRQFSAAMIASMVISSLMAMSLTPALCATLLRPMPARQTLDGRLHTVAETGRLAGFHRLFERIALRYRRFVATLLGRSAPALAVYAALVAASVLLYLKLPEGFLPTEDQGSIQAVVQMPPGATQARTQAVLEQAEQIIHREPAVSNVTSTVGYSDYGSGQNTGQIYIELKDWDQRNISAQALSNRLDLAFDKIGEGSVSAYLPAAVPGLGHSDGFVFRLEDRGGIGLESMVAARARLFELARHNPMLTAIHTESLPDAPRIVLDVDRAKAYTMGVNFAAIQSALSAAFSTFYLDDYPSGGRMQRVLVSGLARQRMSQYDLLSLTVRNAGGTMVPFSSFSTVQWGMGPIALSRYNGYPSLNVTGRPAEGYSSGQAMAELERLARSTLPVGMAYEWTGQAREANQAGAQVPLLLGLSLLAVFLSLAALYESWSVPLSVLMVVPLGVIGAVGAMLLRDLPNDIYFKVGLVTVFGLASKNAILIVQFARELRRRNTPLLQAIVEAASMRFRPIVMTSMAFVLGVLPLVLASGAGAQSRHSIGTGVFGGVIAATVLGLLFAPLTYYVVSSPLRAMGWRTRAGPAGGSAPGPRGPLGIGAEAPPNDQER
jgi:HAE1 family hydrophobic/amphiphilic exporter-1